MTISQDQFVADFPELGAVPNLDGMFGFYADVALLTLNPRRWPSNPSPITGLSLLDRGTELFIAHNIALELRTNKEAMNSSGAIGQAQGPLAGKSVGGVNASYAVGASAEQGGGHWNTTIYGQRFLRMLRAVAAGPVQVNVGSAPPFTIGGWPGPWPYPAPGGSSFVS